MESELQIFTDAASMRAFSRQQRKLGKTVGMVPTMVRVQLKSNISQGRTHANMMHAACT